jgi:hypothetical protein
MWTAMQWTSIIIAALFGVGLNQWTTNAPTSLIVFGLLLPAFSFITMSFWLGEAVRLKRTGDYVYLLERKIEVLFLHERAIPEAIAEFWPKIQRVEEYRLNLASILGKEEVHGLSAPLAWETWLREGRRRSGLHAHLGWLYAVRLGFFLMVSTGSIVLAQFWLNDHPDAAGRGIRTLYYIFGPLLTAITVSLAAYLGKALNVRLRMKRQDFRGRINSGEVGG